LTIAFDENGKPVTVNREAKPKESVGLWGRNKQPFLLSLRHTSKLDIAAFVEFLKKKKSLL
jgi:hypothetical protein